MLSHDQRDGFVLLYLVVLREWKMCKKHVATQQVLVVRNETTMVII